MPEAKDGKKAELTGRVLALRDSVTRSASLRAQAEAQLSAARQQLGKIDSQLKELGIEPDNAEQELSRLETALDSKIADMHRLVNEEIATYNKVVEASKQVFS
jgi:chromosome segregation ATPase